MNDKAYWLWLQKALGYGVNVDEIVGHFKTAKNIYFATPQERKHSGVFTERQLQKIRETPIEVVDDIIKSCRECGCRVLVPDDTRYPKLLKNIRNFPLVLYYLGDPDVLKNRLSIALVGTRKASPTGLQVAGRLALHLTDANVVVVSGGALGIDGAAHLGALSNDGLTVAVLGCGFLAKYHDSVSNLRNDILKKGLIVTEYPPRTAAIGRNFPIRNRIISALSHGVVVVEGAIGSGSLITARRAIEQGRELFAVPGDAINSEHSGTVELIRSGARAVFSCADILSVFEFSHPEFIDENSVSRKPLYEINKNFDFEKVTYRVKAVYEPYSNISEVNRKNAGPAEKPKESVKNSPLKEAENLSGDLKTVYEAIGFEEIHVDDILRKVPSLNSGKVVSALTMLEIKDLIVSVSGKKYRRK